jgi:hypothetical protein
MMVPKRWVARRGDLMRHIAKFRTYKPTDAVYFCTCSRVKLASGIMKSCLVYRVCIHESSEFFEVTNPFCCSETREVVVLTSCNEVHKTARVIMLILRAKCMRL